MSEALEIDTPHGLARAHLHAVDAPRGALVLGHGAGGSVGAPDLVAATAAAREAGLAVALVEQPYRVAGRRSPPAASRLDAVWVAVVEALGDGPLRGLAHVSGGRSSGARVACRTARETGAVGVLCLAFPLVPPRAGPEKSRQGELDGAGVPVLVVQGASDPFGMPAPGPDRDVAVLRGDHGLKSDMPSLRAAVRGWLEGMALTPLGGVRAAADAP